MVRTNAGGTAIQKLYVTWKGMPILAEGAKTLPAQERTFPRLHLLSRLAGWKSSGQNRYVVEVPILAGSAKVEGCHDAPFRIRKLVSDGSYYRVRIFWSNFGKSLTGIRCRTVDSLIRVCRCFRRICRILSPLVHCQIRELDLKLN